MGINNKSFSDIILTILWNSSKDNFLNSRTFARFYLCECFSWFLSQLEFFNEKKCISKFVAYSSFGVANFKGIFVGCYELSNTFHVLIFFLFFFL